MAVTIDLSVVSFKISLSSLKPTIRYGDFDNSSPRSATIISLNVSRAANFRAAYVPDRTGGI